MGMYRPFQSVDSADGDKASFSGLLNKDTLERPKFHVSRYLTSLWVSKQPEEFHQRESSQSIATSMPFLNYISRLLSSLCCVFML